MDEKIIVTAEKAGECRCLGCATLKLQELEAGGVFCSNGPSSKREGELNGCNCQGCPIRDEGGFNGVNYCTAVREVADVAEEPADADVTLKPVGAGSGSVDM